MVRRLDGRVRKWVTLNEPWVITDGGYLHGALAPGHRNLFETPIASHNLMRAHGAAVRAYRSEGAHEIGLVVNIETKYPASDSPADLAASRAAAGAAWMPKPPCPAHQKKPGAAGARKCAVQGQSVSVGVAHGGGPI